MSVVDEDGREVENLVGLNVYWDSQVNQAMITVDSPGWDLELIETDQAYQFLSQLLEDR